MSFLKLFLASVYVFSIVGCTSVISKQGKPQASLTFDQYEPVNLKVDTYSVVTNYEASKETNDRSNYFPMTPLNGIELYLNKRFRASELTSKEHFFVTILDASLPYKLINSDNMFLSALDLNQKEEYTISYVLKLEKLNDDGKVILSTVMRYKKAKQFDRSLSLAELEAAYLDFLQEVIEELDEAIMKSLSQNFRLLKPQLSDAPALMEYDKDNASVILDPSYPNQKPIPLNKQGVNYHAPIE